jgi:putative sterol carrier protein
MGMNLSYGTEEFTKAYDEMLDRRLAEESKPYLYFSPEWIHEYEQATQNDADYKEAAKTWEGTVVLHVEAAPQYGIGIDIYVLMDLWHGDCRSMGIVPPEAGEAGDFVITGSMDQWMKVGRKELDVVKGMMQGKLRLKGDLPTIVRAVKASIRLVDLSSEVGGKYPDELSPEEIEHTRGWITPLGEQFGLAPSRV